MNITGQGQYSKQTVAIKDPRKFMDQQQKLIFIYPILYSDKIKVSSSQPLESIIRDFISVTFLSDLFVQNAFNVIGIANQVRPLWDENRQAVDLSSALFRTSQQSGIYTSGPVMPNYPVGPEHTGNLQQKITQKTAVIQQLLKSDPKFAKTRPFIEVITMGNMIDVPVIVGTAIYPVDTLTLMYVLIAAIGLNRKLTSVSDLDIIFKELESLDAKKYWSLLNNLTRTNKDKFELSNWFRGKVLTGVQVRNHTVVPGLQTVSGWRRSAPTIARTAGNLATRLRNKINSPPELNQSNELLAPLLLNKADLDQTKVYFKFILDPGFARKRFGIDASNEDTKLTGLSQAKLQGELSRIQNVTMSEFSELVGVVGTSLLMSVANAVSIDNSTVHTIAEKSRNIDNAMMDEIDTDLNKILIGIDNGLKASSVIESKNKIKVLKELCVINTIDTLNDYLNRTAHINIQSIDFNDDKFREFQMYIAEFAQVSSSLTNKIENQIAFMTSGQEEAFMRSRFRNLQSSISRNITNFFKPFIDDLARPGTNSRLFQISGVNHNTITGQVIPTFISYLTEIFYFIFFREFIKRRKESRILRNILMRNLGFQQSYLKTFDLFPINHFRVQIKT